MVRYSTVYYPVWRAPHRAAGHGQLETRRFVEATPRPVDSPPVALTIGIVGLPNAGKSTLFNALTKNNVLAANYPFATIEPNVGVVGVPDERLGSLAKIFGSAKILPATVEFVDIAGIVAGASQGEGLGNKFLSHIRESSAICQVTRVFRDEDVTHVDGEVNPASDISTIQTEMILADLQTVEKAIPRLEKEARGNKSLTANLDAAREVMTLDFEQVDALYEQMQRASLTRLLERPEDTDVALTAGRMARNLERLGDHLVNVAERLETLVLRPGPPGH